MSETVPLNLVLSGTSHKRHNWSISNPLLSSPPPSCALSLEVQDVDVHDNEFTLDFDMMTRRRRHELKEVLEHWAEEARTEQAQRDREEAEASAGREAAASAGSSPGGEWFVLAVLLVGGAPKVGVGRA